jgi:hypothetical protein
MKDKLAGSFGSGESWRMLLLGTRQGRRHLSEGCVSRQELPYSPLFTTLLLMASLLTCATLGLWHYQSPCPGLNVNFNAILKGRLKMPAPGSPP